ncbi:hypothetical protein QMK19_41465 [Streptomyces sp. H10-C2]|uniref:hypothetical protein n=1 Tax=unclassified Streptomyces TaxID=2593676 RepID=UPI0024BBA0A4|nr:MULTISPECIES: hypothetical protein [unclassified Streptomyces]MDJ0347691.1 hypothetical protein [Streptomyces sp. PH10-H1]MDJ0375861.1 hypothetical protein [Streptomyces sp. H10-C2]
MTQPVDLAKRCGGPSRRTARLAARIRHLEAWPSVVLGEQVWREASIGGPDDIEQLQVQITTLEQQVIDLELKLEDQGDDLAAARELMAQLNRHADRSLRPTGKWIT